MPKLRKCLVGTVTYTLATLLFLFLIVFVIIPIVFKYSVDIQKSIIFPTWTADAVNFSDVESFDIQGVRNFYVKVNDEENVTLGAWQILPNKLLKNFLLNKTSFDYDDALAKDDGNVLLYLHGNGGVRSMALELYSILRSSFHIIAVDYRGYGDSTEAELTEENIVNDLEYFYKWLQTKSKARLFVWGHSLGSGVGTHLVSNLKHENITPSGLILETPFSTVPDVMERHAFLRLISWLPWYRATMIDPIISNGMGFESTKYITNVDCPILILHAKDDTIIPYDLATKLYEVAVANRDFTIQGNVSYNLFEARGYDHMMIYAAPELPEYIRRFVDVCIQFENKTYRKM